MIRWLFKVLNTVHRKVKKPPRICRYERVWINNVTLDATPESAPERIEYLQKRKEEIKEFQRLWIKKVKNMLLEKDINSWLIVQERRI